VHVNAGKDVQVLERMLNDGMCCESICVSRASAGTTVHSGEGMVAFGFYAASDGPSGSST
jgi:hypothetical protein